MKELGLDPKQYKYLKSDDKTTTLQHKRGHTVTVAHNVLSPKNQAILKALAATDSQQQPQQKADGGDVTAQSRAIKYSNENKTDMWKKGSGEYWAKEAAKDRRREEKQIKPNLKGLANGGYIKEIHSETPEPGYTKMADGGTVAMGLPCLNPNCKSHGRPHPNCRCYGMADGGKVADKSYCAYGKPHMKGCSYYKDGGPVKNDNWLIQDSDILPEIPPAQYPPAMGHSTTADQDTQRHQQEDQENDQYRQANPEPQDNEDQGYETFERQGMAKGGPVPQSSPSMMSGQQPFAKGGNVEAALQEILPWIRKQMQSQGQNPSQPRKAYASSDQPVSQDDSAPSMPFPVGPPDQSQGPDMAQPANPEPGMSASSDDQGGMSTGPATPPEVKQDKDSNQPIQEQPPQDAQQALAPSAPVHPALSSPKVYHKAVTNNIMDEQRAWSQDLSDGKIEPKTYKDLFNDGTGTLGKIGTLFGLMLSGAGSGLAHQPNMLMEMMNKQIDRDLDAQKTSASNRQNYIKMAQQHALNNANILATKAGVKLTNAQTQQALQGVDLKAKMYAQRSVIADLAKKINDMPEGPEKQAGINTLGMMSSKLDANHADMASLFATQQALQHFGNAGTPQGNEAAYQQNQNMLRRGGQTEWANQNDERHIPGIAGQASGPIDPNIKQRVVAMNTLDNQLNNLLGSVNQYKAMSLKGNLDPRVTGPMAVKAHEAAALYNQTLDGLGMTEGRMKWLDSQIPANPQKFMEQLQGSVQKLQEVAKNNKMRRDMVLSGPGGLGFPNQNINTQLPNQSQNQGQQPQPQTMQRNGATYQKVQGGWKKIK